MEIQSKCNKLFIAIIFNFTENEPITCARLQRLGYGSGNFRLDLDGVNGPMKPFPAKCDMTASSTSLFRPNVGTGGSLKKSASCTTNCNNAVDYNLIQMVADSSFGSEVIRPIIERSQYCSHALTLEKCFQVGVVSQSGNSASYWKTSDGLAVRYWHHTATGGGCACGVDNSCQPSGNLPFFKVKQAAMKPGYCVIFTSSKKSGNIHTFVTINHIVIHNFRQCNTESFAHSIISSRI